MEVSGRPGGADLAAALEQGLGHHEAGRLAEAESVYRRILAAESGHAGALHLLGVIEFQRGRAAAAVELLSRAVAADAGLAPAHNNLGNALRALGRTGEAIAAFQAALKLRPQAAEIHSNLGNALKDAGRLGEAVFHYREALGLRSDLPEVCYNLANTLAEAGQGSEAERWYREALLLRPAYPEARFNLGNALAALGRLREAEAAFRAALALRPGHAESHSNLGTVLQELGRRQDAEACYREAVRLDPGYPEAWFNLGRVLQGHDRSDEAIACYRRVLDLKPDHGAARIALCMAQLPILYDDEADIPRRRAAYEAELRRLAAEVAAGQSAGLAEAVGTSQPFFLGYQGACDRELQSLWGPLTARLLAEAAPVAQPLPLPLPVPGEKIRLGLVSGFFCDHTVWRLLLQGWLSQLDRRRFELFCYHTGSKHDADTDRAAALADRFHEGRLPGGRWREIILADAPHVLIYPEIGMDPLAGHLAAQRLAAVQCVSWGHPDTTGLPTIDYFLSSDLMEPENGQDHYSETLVRLPNLATWWEPATHRPLPLKREELGLRPSATVFWSGQALYKYLPHYDAVFPRIAREAGDCQFVFLEFAASRAVTARFRRRLERAFADHDLRFDEHCLILPPLEQEMFIAAVGLADAVLDTIGWSGGRSALDCLSHDIPFVTLPGPLMRGRHTAAILQRLGVGETIAADLDSYVALAVRLAREPAWRAVLAARIGRNKPRLWRDGETIAALEAFLARAVAAPPFSPGRLSLK